MTARKDAARAWLRDGLATPRKLARTIALTLITIGVIGAAAASFAESYRGLFDWSITHGVPTLFAAIAPLMVDVFIGVGELTLFVLVLDGYDWQHRLSAWAITAAGLAVSIAGNIGHTWLHGQLWDAPVANMVTAAVPPVAAAWALAVGLGLLKRLTPQRAKRKSLPSPSRDVTQPAEQPAVKRHAARSTRGSRVAAADLMAAAEAYRASVADGSPLSERRLAELHLGGNRRAASRVVADVSAGGVLLTREPNVT